MGVHEVGPIQRTGKKEKRIDEEEKFVLLLLLRYVLSLAGLFPAVVVKKSTIHNTQYTTHTINTSTVQYLLACM